LERTQIIPAGPQHADLAGALLMETLYGFGVYQTGLGSAERGRQALSAYFRLPGNRFSYEFSHLAAVDDEPAALLLAFPGELFGRLNRKAFWQMPRVYSLTEVVEFFRRALILKDEEEVARYEFYVAHLAVHADFRRKGLGKLLLEHAQNLALQNGLRKVSLLAELENTGAIALYERFGFTTVKTYTHPHQIPLTGSPGYVKMIKTLPIEE
jgi:ribosomal protein S18 acetylase RimI-like enzyme